jgi:hypothetical protein
MRPCNDRAVGDGVPYNIARTVADDSVDPWPGVNAGGKQSKQHLRSTFTIAVMGDCVET